MVARLNGVQKVVSSNLTVPTILFFLKHSPTEPAVSLLYRTVKGYLPTVRGWVALLLPVVGGSVLMATFPARLVESGVGTSIQEPVSASAWILSAAFIGLCVSACIPAFRRGSRVDRIVASLAALLVVLLMREVVAFMVLQVRPAAI